MKPLHCLLTVALACSACAALAASADAAPGADARKPHPKVQQAMDWTLPENQCKEPRSVGTVTNVNNEGADSGPRSDVDSFTLDRIRRKERRWAKCVDKYKKGLKREFETLRGSAQYGLTPEQAEVILGKMKLIQNVLVTRDGNPATDVAESANMQ